MKSPLKLADGSIVLSGSYVAQLTTGRRNRACWTVPAGASRTTILPLALAVSIAVPVGTRASGALTPFLPVGFAYGTAPATRSLRVLPPTLSRSVVRDALQRLTRNFRSLVWTPG